MTTMAQAKREANRRKLEAPFERILRAHFPGLLQRAMKEHRFCNRKWRFDYAWPEGVAVELEGGTWTGGAHTRGVKYGSDCEKYNTAALMGWTVLRYTTDQLRTEPDRVRAEIETAFQWNR